PTRRSSDLGNAAEHEGEQHIKNGTENERSENSDRHVTLRIPRFLCGGRNGIEADVSEEDNACGTENSENSAIGVGDALSRDVSGWGGNHRGVVCRIDEPPADADEEQHNAHLEHND